MTIIVSTFINWTKELGSNLFLSVYSVKFYQQVLQTYTGYGLKYLFTLSFLASLLCSVSFLDTANKLQDYLSKNIISTKVASLEHIINQLPDLDYDGQNISAQESTPLFINNLNNYKIIALDPKNTLSYKDKIQVPILLSSNKIVISIFDTEESTANNIALDYSSIFGSDPITLTQEVIKQSLAKIFNNIPRVLIYAVLPILALTIFVNTLLEKSFIIILLYLLTRTLPTAITLKDCIRLSIFASGFFVLLQPIIALQLPMLTSIVWILQIWTNLLMATAILKSTQKQ